MENFQPLDETMHYQLSATGMLRLLGYNQPIGTGWLEQLKQDKQINLPKTYTEFMELMVDCPLLSTSNLWVGKMERRAAMRIPHTYYDELRERIDDYKGRWSKRPGKQERALYELSQLPTEQWEKTAENYLIIGSDYAGGIGEFGIQIKDLQMEDPPVYWHKEGDSLSVWKLEAETLSDFLLHILIEALACVDYQTAEYELKTKGWRCQEYFDLKKGDWVASKSTLKRYGIDYSAVKKYKASSGKVFCCYDKCRNAFFVGSTSEGELSLTAINRYEADPVFLDEDSLEFLIEEAKLFLKANDQSSLDDLAQSYLYTKAPQREIHLSDSCEVARPPHTGENGELLCPATVKGELLFVLCSGSTFVKVLTRTIKKKPKAANEELAAALNLSLQTGEDEA